MKDKLMQVLESMAPSKQNPWKPGQFLEKQFETLLVEGFGFNSFLFSHPDWSSLKVSEAYDMGVEMQTLLGHDRRRMSKLKKLGNRILLKHVPYESHYNAKHNAKIKEGKLKLGGTENGKKVNWGKSHTEFVILDDLFPHGIRVECKEQDVYGSTDQKLLGLFRDLERMPEPRIVVICGGGGRRCGCMDSLRDDISDLNAKHKEKHFEVFDIDEPTPESRNENLIKWTSDILCV